MNIHDLYAKAQAIAPWITEQRRALHRIPERGFQEFKTQAHIIAQMEALGIPYTTERTWVIADIKGGRPGPCVALRADIDALPVTEPEGCEFRSEHEGRMHACGHDAHTAILIAAGRMLSEMKDELTGSVRLLFQPAEEGPGGATPMIEAGALEGVDAIYGLHLHSDINVGQISSRVGAANANSDRVFINVKGVSGHAAKPNECVDAIVCACQIITALQTLVSRNVSPLKSAVLTIGVVEGGTANNIICDEVRIQGTLRTLDHDVREMMHRRIVEVSEHVAAAMGATVDAYIERGYSALINPAAEVERIERLATELLGEGNFFHLKEPGMGGEDFAHFLEKVPGAFYYLGSVTHQPAPPLHSRDFYVDERCLPIGAALHCALVLDRMKEAK